jgi:hypothetical protein
MAGKERSPKDTEGRVANFQVVTSLGVAGLEIEWVRVKTRRLTGRAGSIPTPGTSPDHFSTRLIGTRRCPLIREMTAPPSHDQA